MRPRHIGEAVAIAAFSWGLSGCAARAADPRAIDDALTSARIRTALVNDVQLGHRAIDVRVTAGVAHVNGGSFTEEEAARLQQIVRAVPGVTEVETTVEIAAPRQDPAPVPAGLVRAKRPPQRR